MKQHQHSLSQETRVYEVQMIYNKREYLLTFNTEGELIDKKSRSPYSDKPFRTVVGDEAFVIDHPKTN